jgi:ketosteroid isomerase-like protein
VAGWWWADPVTAFVVAVAVREGRRAWRGDACCAACQARAIANLRLALGDTEDLILGLYRAYRRQDLDELIDGMHPDAQFKPVPSARTYHGRDDIRLLFEHDIHMLPEFDFRVLAVEAEGDRVLLHGKNRIREAGDVRDAPIYWVGEFSDGLLHRFEPYARLDEATAAFGGQAAGA